MRQVGKGEKKKANERNEKGNMQSGRQREWQRTRDKRGGRKERKLKRQISKGNKCID